MKSLRCIYWGSWLALTTVTSVAHAAVLDFTPGNGITCEGGATCLPNNGQFIDQTYGDQAGQLDVVWDSITTQAGLDRFAFGQVTSPVGNFGGFSSAGSSSPDAEVFLQPLTGYTVTLNSFTLRTNFGKIPAHAVEVFGADGTTLIFSDTLGNVFSQTYTPALSSDTGLRIRFRGDGQQTYIDDINFTVSAVPLPATAWLMGSALVGFLPRGRRRFD